MGLFGGGNSTSSNTSNNYDQRQVLTTTTENYDLSNRSIDNSVSSTTVTDGGAIKAMGEVAAQVVNNGVVQVRNAYDYADSIFDGALTFANSASVRAADAFSQAADMAHDTLVQARSAFQDASRAQATAQAATQAAYADAKGTTDSQKQIVLGVLAVAAIMALSMLQRRG